VVRVQVGMLNNDKFTYTTDLQGVIMGMAQTINSRMDLTKVE
jgi:hypothetical protein